MLQAVRKDYYYPYEEEYQVGIKHIDNKKQKVKCAKTLKLSCRVKAIITIIICFATCFVILYRYSVINESTYRINKYNQELERLITANGKLKVDAEKSVDLITIESIAKNRLKMQRPDQYQIVYMKIPREDYTKLADNSEKKLQNKNETVINSTKSMLFGSLNDSIGRIIKFLY